MNAGTGMRMGFDGARGASRSGSRAAGSRSEGGKGVVGVEMGVGVDGDFEGIRSGIGLRVGGAIDADSGSGSGSAVNSSGSGSGSLWAAEVESASSAQTTSRLPSPLLPIASPTLLKTASPVHSPPTSASTASSSYDRARTIEFRRRFASAALDCEDECEDEGEDVEGPLAWNWHAQNFVLDQWLFR